MGNAAHKAKKESKDQEHSASSEDRRPSLEMARPPVAETKETKPESVQKPSGVSRSSAKSNQQPIALPSLGQYDINPSQAALVKRWKANKEFRESGLEAELAKIVLGDNWETRYHMMLTGRCPLAFPKEEMFIEFLTELLSILSSHRLTGWVALRGSSTTFMSVHPEKGIDPDVKTIRAELTKDKKLTTSRQNLHFFDCKVSNKGGEAECRKTYNDYQLIEMFSDIDLNIKSAELIALLKKAGAAPSSTDVGGCYNQDATMEAIPELWEFKATWGERLQRDISFVGVTSASDTHKYSKHPFTFSIQ